MNFYLFIFHFYFFSMFLGFYGETEKEHDMQQRAIRGIYGEDYSPCIWGAFSDR